MRTPDSEHFGDCFAITSAVDVRARVPRRANAARLLAVTMTNPGRKVVLPDARLLRPGGEPQVSVLNLGANSVAVADASGTTIYPTLPQNHVLECILATNATLAGEWVLMVRSVASGLPVATNAQTFSIEITGSDYDFDLAERVAQLGWDRESPVHARVTIAVGALLGARSTSRPAFRATGLPVGSQAVLTNLGYLLGAGGAGGGGSVAPQNGGVAMEVDIPTLLINRPGLVPSYGTIGGGGGGGQQGAPNVMLVPGGGGGGGAGRMPGRGGAATSSAGYTSGPGTDGGSLLGGDGGFGGASNANPGYRGGNGGNIGQPGQASASPILFPPGSPGLAILGTAHVTKLVTGTIVGGEA